MEFVIVLAVLAVVIVVVSAPLRRPAGGPGATGGPRARESGSGTGERESTAAAGDLADLEAAREAKYREIREAELDHRTGKLSDADYAAVDRELREDAIEILRSLDRAHGRPAR